MSWKQWDIGEVVEAGDFQSLVQDQVVQTYANETARTTALGTAVSEGMTSYISDADSLQVHNGSDWVAVAQRSPNYIINGAFDIWQRGTTFTGVSGYTADRWFVASATNVSRTDSPIGIGYAHTQTRTVGTLSSLAQRVEAENAEALAGDYITVSFYAKETVANSAAGQVRLNYANARNDFSAITLFNLPSFTFSTTWTRHVFRVEAPAEVANGLQIEFRLTAINQEFSIANVMIEAGSSGPGGLPFRRNANSIQGELAACQRYFRLLENHELSGTPRSASDAVVFGAYGAMRDTPTVTIQTLTNCLTIFGVGNFTPTGSNVSVQKRGLRINFSGMTGLTVGTPIGLNLSGEANAITLSSEL